MTQIAILKGNIGKDPEVRFTQTNNTKVVTFSIAVYRPNPKDKDKPFTDWFNCVCWGDQADIAEANLKKGMYVQLTGKFQTRDYEKDGKKVYVTEFWVDEMAQVFKKEKDQFADTGSIYGDDLPF
mgnify:CR=1 FL=1